MKNVIIGQYIPGNSWIHKLDPRSKIISLMFLIIATFLIKDLSILLLFLLATFLILVSSRISMFKFIKGLRPVLLLLFFTFIFQIFINKGGALLVDLDLTITIYGLFTIIAVFVVYFITKKYVKYKFLYFILMFAALVAIQYFVIFGDTLYEYNVLIYEDGLNQSAFILIRIFILISFSSLLTLTTKPTDLNNGLEGLLKPFSKFKIPTSEISMMISISLRFIPTLLEEANKIIKAQASRGVDFNEGSFKDKVKQIISLLIPMFIISFKRADDLANAMESRGYIPGAPRTKLYEMKYRMIDYLVIMMTVLLNLAFVYLLIEGA